MFYRLPHWSRYGVLLLLAIPLILVSLRFMPASSNTDFMQPAKSISHLHGLGVDAVNDRIVLATHHGLFALADGALFQMGDNRDDFMGFSQHPYDPNIIYASGHPARGGNIGVIKSEDGGRTFNRLFTGLEGETVDFHSMTISAADPEVLYGSFAGRLYRSVDAAVSWSFADADGLPAQGGFCWGAPCLAASGTERDTVHAGTPQGVWVSEDLGERWVATTGQTGAVAGVGSSLHQPGVLFAHTESYGVARSADGGQSWEARNTGLQLEANELVFAFVFHPQLPDRVYLATTGNQVYVSDDQGDNWVKFL